MALQGVHGWGHHLCAIGPSPSNTEPHRRKQVLFLTGTSSRASGEEGSEERWVAFRSSGQTLQHQGESKDAEARGSTGLVGLPSFPVLKEFSNSGLELERDTDQCLPS